MRKLHGITLMAAAHLVVVGLGALHVDLRSKGPLGRALGEYAALTGAEASYRSFAPSLDGELFARFEVTEPGGHATTDVLETGASGEADLRVRSIVGSFFQGDEARRRALAASWAGEMLARHPGAEDVVLLLTSYELPSMDELRRGREPRWATRYRARFVPRREGAP